MKRPVVDLSACIRCGVCVDICSDVFALGDAGFVQVRERASYPRKEVDAAIIYCPADCIHWEDNGPNGKRTPPTVPG